MALTQEQSKLVGESWDVMKNNMEIHGVQLFKNIFEIAPEAKGLFSFIKDDGSPVEDNPTLRKHATNVFKTAGETMIKFGEKGEMDALQPTLEALGARHFNYGVQPEHFAVVGQALLKTLEDGFGDKLTPELRAAWAQAYGEVAIMMKSGLEKGATKRAAV
eukprot:TRINITY_DN22499_c0_g1_i1.p1 TRINITY_DN22499_c0_g1~~TRINITY_DN22499_c0_g1_i1.p1  ORF type:complete len:161 (-),score=51.28 TRINITY_DN22499_c0_g1_i1:245-727(-)